LCAAQKDARSQSGDRPCRGDLYPADVVEQTTLDTVREAWQKPKAIAEALRVYRMPTVSPPAFVHGERVEISTELDALKAEQGAVVQAQIAGIRAGAMFDAYADAFVDIAGRRSKLEARRRQILAETSSRKPKKGMDAKKGLGLNKEPASGAVSAAVMWTMEEAWRMLTSEDVPGLKNAARSRRSSTG